MTAQPENNEIQARVSLAMKEALDACPSPRLVPFTPAQMAFLERVLASALDLPRHPKQNLVQLGGAKRTRYNF